MNAFHAFQKMERLVLLDEGVPANGAALPSPTLTFLRRSFNIVYDTRGWQDDQRAQRDLLQNRPLQV